MLLDVWSTHRCLEGTGPCLWRFLGKDTKKVQLELYNTSMYEEMVYHRILEHCKRPLRTWSSTRLCRRHRVCCVTQQDIYRSLGACQRWLKEGEHPFSFLIFHLPQLAVVSCPFPLNAWYSAKLLVYGIPLASTKAILFLGSLHTLSHFPPLLHWCCLLLIHAM